MIEAQFDPYDLSMIVMHAARLRAAREAAGTRTNIHNYDLDDWDAHYIGAMGEYVVSRRLGLKLDKKIYPGRDGRDNGADFMFKGYKMQVKAFTYTGPRMMFFMDKGEEDRAEIFVGVQILKPTRVKLMGWITAKDFTKKMVDKNFNYGMRNAVPEEYLSPFDSLHELEPKHG